MLFLSIFIFSSKLITAIPLCTPTLPLLFEFAEISTLTFTSEFFNKASDFGALTGVISILEEYCGKTKLLEILIGIF